MPGPIAERVAPTPAMLLPPPPKVEATVFLVQTYDVLPEKLDAFEEWFRKSFAPALRAFGGIVSVETSVDRARRGPLP